MAANQLNAGMTLAEIENFLSDLNTPLSQAEALISMSNVYGTLVSWNDFFSIYIKGTYCSCSYMFFFLIKKLRKNDFQKKIQKREISTEKNTNILSFSLFLSKIWKGQHQKEALIRGLPQIIENGNVNETHIRPMVTHLVSDLDDDVPYGQMSE